MKHNSFRSITFFFLLAALLLLPSGSLQAGAAADASSTPQDGSWTGSTDRGQPMSLTVQSSGTQWASFKLKTDFNFGYCSGTLETTVSGPGSITAGQFSYDGSTFDFSGTFDSSVRAHGTYAFTNMYTGTGCPSLTQSGTWNATTPIVPITKSFRSVGFYDGWILETTETSSLGGTINSTDSVFRLGDDQAKKQYRSILSFNTATLPDGASIISAVLKIKKQKLVGSDPFTTHQPLLVDIRQPFFGAAANLASQDFQAAAGKVSAGKFGNTPAGGWYASTLNSSAYSHISRTGTTQFRLRFQKDDDNDTVADYVKFFSGSYDTAASRPVLIIQYYVP
jgi:hypothetical protein